MGVVRREKGRFVKFCIVGGSGVVVNLAVVWAGNTLLPGALGDDARTALSYFLGIVVSIGTNFVLNDVWTWRDREKRGVGHALARLVKYYLVSAIAGGLQFVSAYAVVFLVKALLLAPGVPEVPVGWKLLGALVGIAIGTFVNFFLNYFWTFKK